jgi:hypothetical protein
MSGGGVMAVVDEFPIKSETFRLRAEECRTMAESFNDAQTRNLLLRIAEDYDRMANRGETREAVPLSKRERDA